MSEEKIKGFVYINGSAQSEIQEKIALALNIEGKDVQVSQTQDMKYGDYTSPIALKLSKELKKNPLEIAGEIVSEIEGDEMFEKVQAVAPGFLNFYLSKKYLLEKIVKIDENFGVLDEEKGKKILVEYGQPNTHKAVTVGHVKSAITGMSIARLYENLGYDVVHVNYFGDLGPYVAKSLYTLLGKVKEIKELSDIDEKSVDMAIEIVEGIKKEGGYPKLKEYFGELYVEASKVYESDEDITGIIKDINMKLFDKEHEHINRIYEYTRDICIEYLNDFFKTLGVKYDRQYPESEVAQPGKEIVLANLNKVFVEDQGATIFKGQDYKMSNWVFLTSQGNPTYSGKELGLIQLKFKEYPDAEFALVLTSVEQNEYFRGVIKAWELINPGMVGKYRHIGFGWLLLGNKKTSSRTGTVSYEDMLAEAKEIAKNKISEIKEYSIDEIDGISEAIAKAGFKFNILSHEFHKDINYDPKTFLSLSGFSAPYIIYSYTRAISVLNKVGSFDEKDLNSEAITSNEEIALMRKLQEYPEMARVAAKNLTPQLLCEYLFELANTFNSFYTTNRIIDADSPEVTKARAVLVSKTALVIKKGLYLLGIEPVEKM